MSPELQHELYRAWPEIFREKNFDPSRTAMHYGIEYHDGWAALIDSLCEVVVGHDQQGGHAIPAARQIKEKFGSLRVRFDSRCEFCDGASRLVTAYSERVCEVSGKPGTLGVIEGHGMKTLSADVAADFYVKPEAQVDSAPLAVQAGIPQGWWSLARAVTRLVPVIEFCVSGDQLVAKSAAPDPWTLGVSNCATVLSRHGTSKTGECPRGSCRLNG